MTGFGPRKRTPRAPRRRKCCQHPCPVHDGPPDPWAKFQVPLRMAVKAGLNLTGRPGNPEDWDREMWRAYSRPGVSLDQVIRAALNAPTNLPAGIVFGCLKGDMP